MKHIFFHEGERFPQFFGIVKPIQPVHGHDECHAQGAITGPVITDHTATVGYDRDVLRMKDVRPSGHLEQWIWSCFILKHYIQCVNMCEQLQYVGALLVMLSSHHSPSEGRQGFLPGCRHRSLSPTEILRRRVASGRN